MDDPEARSVVVAMRTPDFFELTLHGRQSKDGDGFLVDALVR